MEIEERFQGGSVAAMSDEIRSTVATCRNWPDPDVFCISAGPEEGLVRLGG